MVNDPLHITPHANKWFETALKSYNSNLIKVDILLRDEIKNNIIAPTCNSPLLLLKTLETYSPLFQRHNISSEIVTFINELPQKIERILLKMADDIEDTNDNVEKIFRSRQINCKVKKIEKVRQSYI